MGEVKGHKYLRTGRVGPSESLLEEKTFRSSFGEGDATGRDLWATA